jgi:hypothetical protein
MPSACWLCVAWVALLCSLMAGCVVPSFPAPQRPESQKRQSVFDHLTEVIVPRQSTKADVLWQLGEPDYRAIGDRAFLYRWSEQQVGAVVGFPLPILLTVRPVEGKAILIRFGADEVVSSATKSVNDQNCFGVPGAEMMYCSGRAEEPINWQRIVDNQYVDTTSGVLVAPDEKVREVFLVAAFRRGVDWVDGAIVVSNRAVIFVDRVSPETPFNRVLITLDRTQIAEVRLARDDGEPSSAVALIVLADGTHVSVAFGSLRHTTARSPFDLQRTRLFIDSVALLIVDSR